MVDVVTLQFSNQLEVPDASMAQQVDSGDSHMKGQTGTTKYVGECVTWPVHGQSVVDEEHSDNPFYHNPGVSDSVGQGNDGVGAHGRYS